MNVEFTLTSTSRKTPAGADPWTHATPFQQQPPRPSPAQSGRPSAAGTADPAQCVAVGLVLCVSVATLYAMRRYRTDEGSSSSTPG